MEPPARGLISVHLHPVRASSALVKLPAVSVDLEARSARLLALPPLSLPVRLLPLVRLSSVVVRLVVSSKIIPIGKEKNINKSIERYLTSQMYIATQKDLSAC